jgi:fructoselysine 6-kinase
MKILAMTCNCADIFPQSGRILPGGNALNLAVSCKKAGCENVYIAGNIGKDDYGKLIKKAAHKYGVDTSRLRELEGSTASSTIYIDENGDRYFKKDSWVNGVWADYRVSEADKVFMSEMSAVATTLYEPDFKNITEIRRKAGFLLSVDFCDQEINPQWEEHFDAVDLFFISGKNKNLETLEKWSKRFKTVFTATLGENGSVSYRRGAKYFCGAAAAGKIVDTTGCGDSYQGAFIVEYLNGKNLESAMRKGSESAAETLSFEGGFKI